MFHSLQIYPLFRMLIFGTLATNTAFWMYQVAVGWLALEMTDSAAFVGLAGFVAGIPILLFSKLPVRQRTRASIAGHDNQFSKLPVRQRTEYHFKQFGL